MIKKILGNVFLWLTGCLLLSIWTIYTSSFIGIFTAAVWFAIPILSYLLNLFAKKHITVLFHVPTTVAKNKSCYGELIIRNNSLIPVSNILCKVKATNRLTGNENISLLKLSAAAGEETKVRFEICSEYCGYLILETEKCCLLDWFGFLPVLCPAYAAAKISVLPDTFVPGISLSLSATAKTDADSWSQTQKGNDMTEVFALRDYVPGDSLKQIHWKLSSKKQQLIVREPSLPVEKSLLIFWDKNTKSASAKEMDAMAECMVSVCQELLNQGITYTIGWTEEKLCVFETIDTDDQLLSAIPRMLKHGANPEGGSGAFINAQDGGYGSYAKVIYLSRIYPEDFEPFSDGEMSFLLCGKETNAADLPAVCFGAETYEEDLQMIEL